jgi:hypothetical protein
VIDGIQRARPEAKVTPVQKNVASQKGGGHPDSAASSPQTPPAAKP